MLKRFLLFTPNLANESQRGRRERNRRRKGRGIGREEEGLSLPSLSLLLLHFFRPSRPSGRLFAPSLQALQTAIVSLKLKVNDTKIVKTERGINRGFLGIMGSK